MNRLIMSTLVLNFLVACANGEIKSIKRANSNVPLTGSISLVGLGKTNTFHVETNGEDVIQVVVRATLLGPKISVYSYDKTKKDRKGTLILSADRQSLVFLAWMPRSKKHVVVVSFSVDAPGNLDGGGMIFIRSKKVKQAGR